MITTVLILVTMRVNAKSRALALRASDMFQNKGDLVEDTFCLVNWDVVHEGRVCFGVIPERIVD